MFGISDKDIAARISRDNPWWGDGTVTVREDGFPRRVYFRSLSEMAINVNVQRATVLLGPRRVGKTVMLNVTVDESIIGGLVVKVGSKMIDSSIKTKLAKMNNAMKEVG